MRGMGRSIHYWVYMMEKIYLTVLGAVSCTALIASFSREKENLTYPLLMTYILIAGTVVLIVQGFSNPESIVAQAISYGSTRKEVLVGMLVSTHIVGIQTLFLLKLCSFVLKQMGREEYVYANMGIYTGIIICVIALGTLISTVSLRFGRKKSVFCYAISMFAVLGFVIYGAISTGGFVFLESIRGTVLLGIGGAADIFTATACSMAIKNYEVRV